MWCSICCVEWEDGGLKRKRYMLEALRILGFQFIIYLSSTLPTIYRPMTTISNSSKALRDYPQYCLEIAVRGICSLRGLPMERTLHRVSRSWYPTPIRRRGTLVNAGHEGQLICGLKFKIATSQGFTCYANRMFAALRRPAPRSQTAVWGRSLSCDLLGLPRV